MSGRFGKVAVLMGGWSAEREISLQSGRAVLAALQARGIDAHGVDVDRARLLHLADEVPGSGPPHAQNASHPKALPRTPARGRP